MNVKLTFLQTFSKINSLKKDKYDWIGICLLNPETLKLQRFILTTNGLMSIFGKLREEV